MKSFPCCHRLKLPAGRSRSSSMCSSSLLRPSQHLAASSPSSNAAMVTDFTGSSVFVPTGQVSTYEEGIVFPLHTATEKYNFGRGHVFVAGCYCPKENKVYVGCDPKLQPVRAAQEDLKILHASHSDGQDELPKTMLPFKQDPVFFGGSKLGPSYPDTAVANGVYDHILEATFEKTHDYPPLHEFIMDKHGLFGSFCGSTERGFGDILVLRERAVDKIDEMDENSDHAGRFLGLHLFKFLHLNMFRLTKEQLASALAYKPAPCAPVPPPCLVSVARGVTCGNLIWKFELRKLEGEGAKEATKPFPTRLQFFEEEN